MRKSFFLNMKIKKISGDSDINHFLLSYYAIVVSLGEGNLVQLQVNHLAGYCLTDRFVLELIYYYLRQTNYVLTIDPVFKHELMHQIYVVYE